MRKKLLDKLVEMKKKDYDFLLWMVDNTIRYNLYISNIDIVKKAREELNITSPTYYKRIKTLADNNIIRRLREGMYEIDSGWMELFVEDKSIEKRKKQ